MRKVTLGAFIALASIALPALAQAPATPYISVIGTVQNIDAATFTVKTDKGETTTVKFDDRTNFLKVPPGETDMKKATKAVVTDAASGDRILARVRSTDPTGIPALTLYIMKSAEIAQRAQKTAQEWATQSTAGLVKSVDAAGRKVIISVRAANGPARDVTLDLAGNVDYQRTNPDTFKYEPSNLAAIETGDQARVLGTKNADATEIKVEAIATSAIKSIPVQVKSVDTAANQISATDLASKKPIIIAIKTETNMKRLDDATALMLARRMNPTFQAAGGGRGGRGGGNAGGDQPLAAPAGDAAATAPAGGGQGGGRGFGGPGGGGGRGFGGGRGGRGGAAVNDPSRILETQQTIELPDLKPGEPLIVTGPTARDMSKLTAMTLVAGVDQILRAAPQNGPDPLGGNWNFGEAAPPQ